MMKQIDKTECNKNIKNYNERFYIICNNRKTILFEKIDNKKNKTINNKEFNNIQIISNEEVLNFFSGSILFNNKQDFKSEPRKEYKFYMIVKDSLEYKIIPVKRIQVLS